MDQNRYKEWLDLFTDDALYWIPSNHDVVDPSRHMSIVYADRAQLESQVGRLMTGDAYTQVPPSRLSRIIANVEAERAEGGEVHAFANWNLTELRKGKQRTLAGRSEYRLRPADGGFRIAYKKVELVANDEVIDNLTFLV